jgi:hypothetical protein
VAACPSRNWLLSMSTTAIINQPQYATISILLLVWDGAFRVVFIRSVFWMKI